MNVVNAKVTYYLAGLLAGSKNFELMAQLKEFKGPIKVRNSNKVSFKNCSREF